MSSHLALASQRCGYRLPTARSTMAACTDVGAQAMSVGFQCCSCCGMPGRKKPTCSCTDKAGNRHQCLKELKQMQDLKRCLRKWCYFVAALWFRPLPLVQPMQPAQLEASGDDGGIDVV